MKKKLICIASALILAAAKVSAVEYCCDIQVNIGAGFDSMSAVSREKAKKIAMNSALFEIDVASWNLFALNDFFAVGFMTDANGGFGGTVYSKLNVAGVESVAEKTKGAAHFNELIGPAVAFNVKNKVQINAALCVAFGGTGFTVFFDDSKINYSMSGIGFGTVLNAKIQPKRKISPIAGFRFAAIPSKKVTVKDKNSKTKSYYDSGTYISSQIFIGAAYNF